METRKSCYLLRAAICRALGHPVRFAILDLLAVSERSNAELLAALGVSKVNLSQHLAVMRSAGLVESRHHGREAFHRLAIDDIKHACRAISEILVRRLEQDARLVNELNASRGEISASQNQKS